MIISALIILGIALLVAIIVVVLVLSFMPLGVLFILSDISFVFVYYVFRYRRRVVRTNLERSFPEKSVPELRRIERQFYLHLCDMLFEGIYNLRAKPERLMKHYVIKNRDLVNKYYEQGRSVVLMSAHYNNWEFMITTLDLQVRHHGIGVGKPINNKRIGTKVTQLRSRYGTEIVDQTNVREVMAYYDRYHVPVAYMMLSDQSPSNPYRSYWTQFLHQDTAFLYGAEHFARKYNMPVLYYEVDKVRRGYYEVTFHDMVPDVASVPEGHVTQRYAQELERAIREEPQYWLWSHRRWKLTRNGRILKDGSIKIIEDKRKTTQQ